MLNICKVLPRQPLCFFLHLFLFPWMSRFILDGPAQLGSAKFQAKLIKLGVDGVVWLKVAFAPGHNVNVEMVNRLPL